MKKWESPVIKVMSVKLNENIASSNGADGYKVSYVYYDLGGITRGGANYRFGSNGIQDTGIMGYQIGSQYVVSNDDVGAISGCLA